MPIPSSPTPPKSYETWMRRLALAILVVGLGLAGFFYLTAPEEREEDILFVQSLKYSKSQRLQLERIGGKTAVALAEFNDWFEEQWQGWRLSRSVALLSLALAGLCYRARKL